MIKKDRIEYDAEECSTHHSQCSDGLRLHDARIVSIVISDDEYRPRNITLKLDTRAAMASAQRLLLLDCSSIQMDDLLNCWWMGEEIKRNREGLWLKAECISQQDEIREFSVVCKKIILE